MTFFSQLPVARRWHTLSILLLLTAGAAPAQQVAPRLAPVEGGHIEYFVSGPPRGEPVLLIHGGWVADAFVPLTHEPALDGYRLILMHRRGYAGSSERVRLSSLAQEAADAAAVLDDLGIKRAHVVAHSWGGQIAIRLAHDKPEIVQSLVLLEAAPLALPEQASPKAEAAVAPRPPDPKLQAAIATGDSQAIAHAALEMIHGPHWREDLLARDPTIIDQIDQDADSFVHFELPMFDPTLRQPAEYYAEVTQPALVLWGSESPVAGGRLAAELLPNAERYEMQGAGHSMLTEKPKQTAKAIAAFLSHHPM